MPYHIQTRSKTKQLGEEAVCEADPCETCIVCVDKYDYNKTGKMCRIHGCRFETNDEEDSEEEEDSEAESSEDEGDWEGTVELWEYNNKEYLVEIKTNVVYCYETLEVIGKKVNDKLILDKEEEDSKDLRLREIKESLLGTPNSKLLTPEDLYELKKIQDTNPIQYRKEIESYTMTSEGFTTTWFNK